MSEETEKVDFEGIEIDTKKAMRIMRSIIIMELENLNTHRLGDKDMCKNISNKIEEIVKCN